MSTQWEVVVGKSKRSKNGEKKFGVNDRKKMMENGPKLEEILPSHQVKSLFANVSKDKNKENKKPSNKPASKPTSPKKSVKTETQQPQAKKSAPPPQPNKPKNMEAALNAIDASELESLFTNLKMTYKDSQLVWLKGICSHLNTRLEYDADPTFANKPIQYPSNVIPKPLKSVLQSILKSVDEVNIAYFFEQSLAALVTDMSKNQCQIGSKILIQLIAQEWPQVCSQNLAKSAILRNSYQNRSNIGLSLLWALGQGGYYDLTVGVKVWQNIMVPVLDMKSYTKYVCEYIDKIFKVANKNSKIVLTNDEFFAVYTTLLQKSNNGIPREYQNLLKEVSFTFVKKYVQSTTKVSNVFLNLFKNIESLLKNELEMIGCVECLLKNDDCFKVWKMNYKKNLLPSLLLLDRINRDWDKFPAEFRKSVISNGFLDDIRQINNDLLQSKRKTVHVEELSTTIGNLQEKSTQLKKKVAKKSVCPWMCGTFLLFLAVGGVIGYDTYLHGGVFEKSATGKVLKDIGALPYVETAWYKTMSNGARGYQWLETNVPVYYGKTKVVLKPYTDLTCDLYKITLNTCVSVFEWGRNYVVTKTPVVADYVNKYVPGLPQKLHEFSLSAWSSSVNAYHSSCDFFRTKVFIGSLSPENLGKALNQTQIAAAQYYSWFHEKVDAYAKIK